MKQISNQSGSVQVTRKTAKSLQLQDAVKQQSFRNDDEFIKRGTAARQLGVSVQALCNWAWKGHPILPMYKFGRNVRYRQSDVTAFKAANIHFANQCDVSGVPHAY